MLAATDRKGDDPLVQGACAGLVWRFAPFSRVLRVKGGRDDGKKEGGDIFSNRPMFFLERVRRGRLGGYIFYFPWRVCCLARSEKRRGVVRAAAGLGHVLRALTALGGPTHPQLPISKTQPQPRSSLSPMSNPSHRISPSKILDAHCAPEPNPP